VSEGTVKFFSQEKGWGFIKVDGENGPEVFVHYSAILGDGYRNLEEGQRVEFELLDTDKGKQASAVKLLDAPA